MADQNLNIGIKVTSDTAGAKQATAAIDGVDKAVADLAKTEKEATNINGMYLDSLGRIHDESGKFVKVSAEERAGLKERIKIQQQDTVTTTGAVAAKKELGKSSSNSAMGILALSNAFQDAQYGMAGMINNIPGIVAGMGLGMGVAGAAQAAAVGIQILSKSFNSAEDPIKKAALELRNANAEINFTAESMDRSVEATKKATAAQKDLADELARVAAEHKAVADEADRSFRAQQRLADIELRRVDALADLKMAEIEAQEAMGAISAREADAAKGGVRSESLARRAAVEAQTLKAEEDALQKKKAAAEKEAAQQNRILSGRLNNYVAQNMLNDDERKAAEKRIEAEVNTAELKRKEAENEAEALRKYEARTAGEGGLGAADETYSNQRKAIIKQKQIEAAAAMKSAEEAVKALALDKAAREQSGIGSRDAFMQARAAAQSRVSGLLQESAGFGESITGVQQRRASASELEGIRTRAASFRSSAAAASRAAAENQGYPLGFAGPIPPQGFAADQKAADAAAKAAEKEAKELARETVRMVRSLAAGLKFSKEEIAGLAALVDDLRTSK
jgi:hypothetical protein